GVQLAQDTTGGAAISGVVDGSPAAQAGLQAGDTVTAVGGTTVDSADALSSALAKHNPGDQVRITWVDSAGSTHSATITLVARPPGCRTGSLPPPGRHTGAAADSARVRRGAGACDLVVLVDRAGAHADAAGHRSLGVAQQDAAGEDDELAAAGGLDPVQRGTR